MPALIATDDFYPGKSSAFVQECRRNNLAALLAGDRECPLVLCSRTEETNARLAGTLDRTRTVLDRDHLSRYLPILDAKHPGVLDIAVWSDECGEIEVRMGDNLVDPTEPRPYAVWDLDVGEVVPFSVTVDLLR